MSKPVKIVEVRLYLSGPDEKRAEELFKRVAPHLTKNKAVSAVFSAGLEAMEESGWVVSVPMRFHVRIGNDGPGDQHATDTQILEKGKKRADGK